MAMGKASQKRTWLSSSRNSAIAGKEFEDTKARQPHIGHHCTQGRAARQSARRKGHLLSRTCTRSRHTETEDIT